MNGAEAAHREALAIARKNFDVDHPRLGLLEEKLGHLLLRRGDLTGAERLYRESFVIARKSHPNDPFGGETIIAGLAEVFSRQTNYADAELLLHEFLMIQEKAILGGDWWTFNSRSLLGGSLMGQKKYAEAEPLLLSGYEGMKQCQEKIPAAGKRRLQEAVQRLVQLYETTARPEQAAEWKKTLVEFNESEK